MPQDARLTTTSPQVSLFQAAQTPPVSTGVGPPQPAGSLVKRALDRGGHGGGFFGSLIGGMGRAASASSGGAVLGGLVRSQPYHQPQRGPGALMGGKQKSPPAALISSLAGMGSGMGSFPGALAKMSQLMQQRRQGQPGGAPPPGQGDSLPWGGIASLLQLIMGRING